MTSKLRTADRWVIGLTVAAGAVLLVIGVRFLIVPQSAARFFGLPAPSGPTELHLVVGLRDIWLALTLSGLAILRAWRGLALCMALGTAVCLGDAAIVAASSGRYAAIAFHLASGLYCGGVAWAAWRAALRRGDS